MSRLTRLALPLLVLGVIGLADATYLTVQHYRQAMVPCFVGTACETVTTSSYATLGPVPLALLGAIYYLVITLGTVATLEARRWDWLHMLWGLTIGGFLFSLYLLYLQSFVLHAYCIYCLLSAGTSIGLFGYSLWAYTHYRKTLEI